MTKSNTDILHEPFNVSNLPSNTEPPGLTNQQLQSRLHELELLIQLNSTLSLTLDCDETLDAIRQFFLANFDLDRFALVLKEKKHKWVVRTCFGPDPAKEKVLKYPPDSFFYKETVIKKRPYYCRDLQKSQHDVKGFQAARGSLLVIPLANKLMGFIGLLFLHRQNLNAFSESEIDFFSFISDPVSSTITRVRIHQKTKNLAFTDELTGVFNRRYFNQRYTREIGRAKRYNRRLSTLMIDIDHFKQYNDTFGHILGDRVLKEMADIFEQNTRKADVICRYGGEEFVILLPELDSRRAVVVAEKLRTVVENSAFPNMEKLAAGKITISLGVASFPQDGSDDKDVLNQADKALYNAKKQGRNRVAMSTP